MAIAVLIIEVLKLLVSEELVSLEDQKEWHENELFEIFDLVIKDAEDSLLQNEKYLAIFDLPAGATAAEVWNKLYSLVKDNISEKHRNSIEFLLEHGSLSKRILKAINNDFSEAKIKIGLSAARPLSCDK